MWRQARPSPCGLAFRRRRATFATSQHDVNVIRESLRALGEEVGGDSCVTLDLEHPRIAMITLCNPRRRNAVTPFMMAQLADCVERLEACDKWAGSCVVLKGQGHWFCAGMDLRVTEGTADQKFGSNMSILMADTLNRLNKLPLVSVAAVEGGAFGGGAETLTSCDHVVVSDDAKVQFVHANMGLSPGWGGATRLTKLVGRRQALRLLCGATRVKGAEIVDCGLADAVVPAGEVLKTVVARLEGREAADECGTGVTALGAYARDGAETEVLRALKGVVSVADHKTSAESAQAELQCFVEMWGAPPNRRAIERMNAAAERRRSQHKAATTRAGSGN